MSEENKVNIKTIEDLKKHTKGKWAPDLIDKVVKEITSLGIETYNATTEVHSSISSLHFDVSLDDDDKVFKGDSRGLTFSSVGISVGTIFTNNLAKLYSDTTVFYFTGFPKYLTLYFFDKHHSLCGRFRGTPLSFVPDFGCGAGLWR
ncbi:VapA/VapB family virulence-associated protein [Xenorhabdus innexi]|uniref:Uncharacterized protein n=1 Tax=Xenorhabdus innexi TaxID=290109 RepID=A0A1N6MW40_9GAMM|nr:VapA/VapB family virulence-associated protein [Xenorhabdus innexi]PHM30987.1 hypothetical protein Xinn_03172 [Xenorhabdus innexi]SIP73103.1 hypothetical protein XIS1_1730020 [Xenorhabdus innexi]